LGLAAFGENAGSRGGHFEAWVSATRRKGLFGARLERARRWHSWVGFYLRGFEADVGGLSRGTEIEIWNHDGRIFGGSFRMAPGGIKLVGSPRHLHHKLFNVRVRGLRENLVSSSLR